MKTQTLLETTYLSKNEKRNLVNRLSRIQGQIGGIKRMVEEGECVDKILIQIAAARSALNGVGKILVTNHLINSSTICMKGSNYKVKRRIVDALLKFGNNL